MDARTKAKITRIEDEHMEAIGIVIILFSVLLPLFLIAS